MARISVALLVNLFLEGSATKDGNLSVTDGECKHYTVHNGTFPAFANSSTRGHAFTIFCVAQAIKAQIQGSTTTQRQVFTPYKKSFVVKAICIHRLRLWTHSRTTVKTDTTLDTDDEQARVPLSNNPSANSSLRSVFGYFAEQASLTCTGAT